MVQYFLIFITCNLMFFIHWKYFQWFLSLACLKSLTLLICNCSWCSCWCSLVLVWEKQFSNQVCKACCCSNLSHVIIFTNTHYYSFKIFLHFWLGKVQCIIHHNQLLLTKFGRFLWYVKNDINGACTANCQIIELLTEKTWGQGWVLIGSE